MANVAAQLEGGKAVKTDERWGWVKSLESGGSSFVSNVRSLAGTFNEVSSVIRDVFGTNTQKSNEVSGSGSSLNNMMPLLALGGGLALLLK